MYQQHNMDLAQHQIIRTEQPNKNCIDSLLGDPVLRVYRRDVVIVIW